LPAYLVTFANRGEALVYFEEIKKTRLVLFKKKHPLPASVFKLGFSGLYGVIYKNGYMVVYWLKKISIKSSVRFKNIFLSKVEKITLRFQQVGNIRILLKTFVCGPSTVDKNDPGT